MTTNNEKYITYGHGTYHAAAITRSSRATFVDSNTIYFSHLPVEKRKLKLGELWDACNEALPKEPPPETAQDAATQDVAEQEAAAKPAKKNKKEATEATDEIAS